MNKSNEWLMAVIVALRKLPRWALIMITLGVIIILGIAMFLLLPQSSPADGDAAYVNSAGLAFSVFLKLGVIVLLIGVLAIILKRLKNKNQGYAAKQIQVLETVNLTPHRTLYLVTVGEQKILIGATDQSLTNLFQLGSLDDADESLQSSNTSQKFSDLLDQANNLSDK